MTMRVCSPLHNGTIGTDPEGRYWPFEVSSQKKFDKTSDKLYYTNSITEIQHNIRADTGRHRSVKEIEAADPF